MASCNWRLPGALLLSLVLAACGGGGGSSSGGNGSPTDSRGTTSESGVVPSAPALGATLAADATTLRPLIAGASWGYSGTRSVNGTNTGYSDTVTQTASGGAFIEASSNAFNAGTDSATVSASGGTITSRVLAELVVGHPQELSYPELRSPVRQNDQVTIVDKHYADIGEDLDRDGKNESGDFGVYRIVVGMEDVALLSGTMLHAVRVDTIALVRVTLSSTGTTTPATQAAVQSTWYAPGIGIVKQRLTTPVSATNNDVAEEVLTYFDGITRGFGAKAPVEVRMAADAAVGAGQAISNLTAVVPFADHAIVIGTYQDPASLRTQYTTFTSIDTNGKTLRSSLYTGIPGSDFLALDGQLLAVAPRWNAGQYCQAELLHFDAHGAQFDARSNSVVTFAPAVGKTRCSDVTQMKSASDRNRLWLAVVRHSLDSSGWITDLFVQPFDANGVPLAGETTLHSVNTRLSDYANADGIELRSLSAGHGRVVVSYATDASGSLKLASVAEGGLVTRSSVAPATAGTYSRPAFLVKANTTAMLWHGPQDRSTQLAPVSGVLLDSNLVPVLSSSTSNLDAQNLPAPLASCTDCALFFNGTGDHLLVAGARISDGKPWTMSFATLSASAGPLASQPVLPVQVSLADIDPYGSNISKRQVVPFADRALVLAVMNSRLYAKVVWLP